MERKKQVKDLCISAAVAALYVIMTYISAIFGLSGGVIQLRLSEALCVLPLFCAGAVPGLFVGCIISNVLFGGVLIDVIFGSLATLLGAVGTYLIGKKHRYAALIPPVLANTLIVPFVIVYAYGAEQALWFIMLTVGIGEVLSCGVLGALLYRFFARIDFLFK